MKTEKHCKRHGPLSHPYCVECWKDDHAKESADDRLGATACSPCDSAYADFHETRRETLVDYIEDRVTRHVKDGGNDSPSYRKDCAYDGMRDLPGHSDRDIWNAAWKACLENS